VDSPGPERIAVAIVVLLAVLAVADGCGAGSSPGSSTTAAVAAGGVPAVAPALSDSERLARAWIRLHGRAAREVGAGVAVVQLAFGQFERSPTHVNNDQLFSIAEVTQSGIEPLRTGFAHAGNGTVGNAERAVARSVDDLGGAMEAIVAYTSNPVVAKRAQMASRYEDAVAEWDGAVRRMWHIARRRGPPSG
jgi:hypothetical protein